ncbi:hypothetical protein PV762_00930 [Mitsuaria sp. CC2]|uniref:hypothetical protein n=1 Tax=Mitsuaria sp. CC2 TaxID=3029186 RepID=UPI003B8DE347
MHHVTPGLPQGSPFPLLDHCGLFDSQLDRDRGEVRIRALQRCGAAGKPPRCSHIHVRPLEGPGRVTADQQDADLAIVERLLLLHLEKARRRSTCQPAPGLSAQSIIEEIANNSRNGARMSTLAPEWTLDHRVLRTHRQPFSRLTPRPDSSHEWTTVRTRSDHAALWKWTMAQFNLPPKAAMPLPPRIRPSHPKDSKHGIWVAFQIRGGDETCHLIARRLAHAPTAILVQGEHDGRQRHFHLDRSTLDWRTGLPQELPERLSSDPVRFVAVGHRTFAPGGNQLILNTWPASALVDHLLRFVDQTTTMAGRPQGSWRPAHVSLASCTLESPVSPYSYAEDVLRRLSDAWGARTPTVSARSRVCGMRAEALEDRASGPSRLRAFIIFDQDEPHSYSRPPRPRLWIQDSHPDGGPSKSGDWAKNVPRATWLFRRGPSGDIERADKYPHGGKAWITDERIADPPPAGALIAWLGARPAHRPAPGHRPQWESDRTHVMLGEVWISLNVLHCMGARVGDRCPPDTATLAVPGTYARLRFDPVRLLAFVRGWPAPDDLIPALRLLKQALRDEVPPLTPSMPTDSLRALASRASAQPLLRAVARSIGEDLTLAEPLWRHLQ